FLHGCVNRNCDIYLDELQSDLENVCGAQASLSMIWKTLKRSGFQMKKLTRQAIERSAQKRAEYLLKIDTFYESEQLVFVDESAADRRTTYRNRAW
ncbi:hypothetical protein CPB83DRAFT_738640, partial [Crepidotus variabilis]